MSGILVFGELSDGSLDSITGELIAAGRILGDKLGEEIGVALLGSGADGVSQEVISLGADRVYSVQDALRSWTI